jgi:hypothetical protein
MWQGFARKLDALDDQEACDQASFYVSFAQADLLDCVKWQLAQPDAVLGNNPFWPLVGCYRLGIYPFSIARSAVVLFRFVAQE